MVKCPKCEKKILEIKYEVMDENIVFKCPYCDCFLGVK
jgi:hypothetical protein